MYWVGPQFSNNGLYTIVNPNDSAVVELRVSSKYGCGKSISIKHTFYTKKNYPLVTGRDTTINTCSGSKMNYNLDATSNTGNTYTWTAQWVQGGVAGYNDCNANCGHDITDLLVNNGLTGQVKYTVQTSGSSGCSSIIFYVTVNVLQTPILTLFPHRNSVSIIFI